MGIEIEEVAKDIRALHGEGKGVAGRSVGDGGRGIVGCCHRLQPLIETLLKLRRIDFSCKYSVGKVTLQTKMRAFGMILRR